MRPSSWNGTPWLLWTCLALVLALGAAPAALAETGSSDETAAAAPLADLLLDSEPAQSVEPAPADGLESLFQEPTSLSCGFPPPPPPSSCTCSGCCQCNRCWNNGRLAKCLDRS